MRLASLSIIRRRRQVASLGALVALVFGLAIGCEPSEEQPATPAEQAEGEADDQQEVVAAGPKGPPSIDHGGITEIPTDPALVEEGEELFRSKACAGCHQEKDRLVGPALGGVTERREPEWLAKMIMHPNQMLQKDPIAKGMLAAYATPMPNQGVEPDEARALLAYLNTLEP